MVRVTAYNLKQVAALQDKIVRNSRTWKHYNVVLTGESFTSFVHDLGQLLGNSVPLHVLGESCVSLLGKELTQRRLNAFALRIAADRKSTRLNSSHLKLSRMPSSA